MNALWIVVAAAICYEFVITSAMPPNYEDFPYYNGGVDYMDYQNMEMEMCPMMDCSYLEFMLECEPADRYVPRVMMYGVMCDTCPQCRDFPYYRSLVESTLNDMQEMFERTVIMQNFLDDNSNIVYGIGELHGERNPAVVDAFQSLLDQNAQILRDYAMFDALSVIESLEASSNKLSLLLEGSKGEMMADILTDFTPIKMTKMGEDAVHNSANTFTELIFQCERQIDLLTRRHNMIKKVVEEEAPILRTLLALPEADFQNLWEEDRTTARVAFRLLERSQEAVRSLLSMNMDQTGSSLQHINRQAETLLITFWESQPVNDIVGTHAMDDNMVSEKYPTSDKTGNGNNTEDGSGELSGGDAIMFEDTNTLTRQNNLFFQWLSNRYIKQT